MEATLKNTADNDPNKQRCARVSNAILMAKKCWISKHYGDLMENKKCEDRKKNGNLLGSAPSFVNTSKTIEVWNLNTFKTFSHFKY